MKKDFPTHLVAAYTAPAHRARFSVLFEQFEQGRVISFNLGAAFWSFFWFFYHKMYGWGAVGALVFVAFDQITGNWLARQCWGPVGDTIRFFAPIIASIITMGLFADWLYWRHCRARVRKLWLKYGNELQEAVLMDMLGRQGGVELQKLLWAAGFIVAVMVVLLGISWRLDPQAFWQGILVEVGPSCP